MRVKIMRDGRVIGSIPRPERRPSDYFQIDLGRDMGESIDSPMIETIPSPFYAYRRADFAIETFVIEKGWATEQRLVAGRLGDGDLELIVGFEWDEDYATEFRKESHG